jgi:predicted lipoprotein with Yx(FWY)xxD motif
MKIAVAAAVMVAAGVIAPGAMSERNLERGTLTAHSSRFGQILFDGKGFVLYAFTKDLRGRSVCYGACAAAWPPYIVKSAPRASTGTKKSLLGTTRRKDGKLQATYAGRPLYYYVGDGSPYEIRCQNVDEFGGLWLVARPNGTLVR